ncbi:DUF1801 domain-containing protein [Tessaracoccus sp. OS52]|uniref:iron chaperone n=1 Tax=Tessaracoccus sp. OS52 TaxID=2886691 RepID=UPI001D124702|nr:DUF1801 domain-containing protein [Tessaracoccus sp. OS52]MCC2593804.1 DUF1801 domain-containing protein [Tessaracoccus sp. OS52]
MSSAGLSKEERAAIKERAAEVRAPRKRMTKQEKAAQDAQDVEQKIASLEGSDKEIAERIHRIVTTVAPQLAPKLWYGMPAYALDGNVLCFFQDAKKFGARYATFGFNDRANLDDGTLWATSFAITAIGAKEEEQLTALVRNAVGDRD